MIREKKILVADDDVQFVESVRVLLESVGYVVFHTYHAKDVIDTAKDVKPDLILLDVMFAGPPGPERSLPREQSGHDITLVCTLSSLHNNIKSGRHCSEPNSSKLLRSEKFLFLLFQEFCG